MLKETNKNKNENNHVFQVQVQNPSSTVKEQELSVESPDHVSQKQSEFHSTVHGQDERVSRSESVWEAPGKKKPPRGQLRHVEVSVNLIFVC